MRDLNYTALSRTLDAHQADALASRAAILRDAAKGDEMARFVAQKVLGLSGWYNRDSGGNLIGDLESVVGELEMRGIPRFSWQPSPLMLERQEELEPLARILQEEIGKLRFDVNKIMERLGIAD